MCFNDEKECVNPPNGLKLILVIKSFDCLAILILVIYPKPVRRILFLAIRPHKHQLEPVNLLLLLIPAHVILLFLHSAPHLLYLHRPR